MERKSPACVMPTDPSTIYVKRIVALAGDRIVFREGRAFVNGAAMAEPYICLARDLSVLRGRCRAPRRASRRRAALVCDSRRRYRGVVVRRRRGRVHWAHQAAVAVKARASTGAGARRRTMRRLNLLISACDKILRRSLPRSLR